MPQYVKLSDSDIDGIFIEKRETRIFWGIVVVVVAIAIVAIVLASMAYDNEDDSIKDQIDPEQVEKYVQAIVTAKQNKYLAAKSEVADNYVSQDTFNQSMQAANDAIASNTASIGDIEASSSSYVTQSDLDNYATTTSLTNYTKTSTLLDGSMDLVVDSVTSTDPWIQSNPILVCGITKIPQTGIFAYYPVTSNDSGTSIMDSVTRTNLDVSPGIISTYDNQLCVGSLTDTPDIDLSLDLFNSSGVTISCWIYRTITNWGEIFRLKNNDTNDKILSCTGVGASDSDPRYNASLFAETDADGNQAGSWSSYSFSDAPDNVWFHYAATFIIDPSTLEMTAKCYINGTFSGSIATMTLATLPTNLRFQWLRKAGLWGKGLALYYGILSDNDIEQLFNYSMC